MKKRQVEDDFFQQDECQFFLDLAEEAAVMDDGYNEYRKSPKHEFETFSGLSLSRAALMVAQNKLNVEKLDKFVSLTETALDRFKTRFDQSELYFSFTHLVCRAANLQTSSSADHMSHDVHADNCINFPNGTCSRALPAFGWRHFSAIIYLNHNFEGGELVFVSDNTVLDIKEKIKPKCGRLVMFSSGPENLHGVLGIKEGRRCALGLWFTKHQQYSESERILAKEVLNEMRTEGRVSSWLKQKLQEII